MSRNFRITVLISGTGSNLQALIDARAAGRLDLDIIHVISNVADAPGLERARRAGINTSVLEHGDFEDRSAFDRALALLAAVGEPGLRNGISERSASNWLRITYNALVEPGSEPALAEPDPGGRERQPYVSAALEGRRQASWFRSVEGERAIVAVAEPVSDRTGTIGAVVLQQGTDAILSLRNEGLARLMNVTMIATLLVAATLLGYATWLSRRIRRLSVAAETALIDDDLRTELPSSEAGDEVVRELALLDEVGDSRLRGALHPSTNGLADLLLVVGQQTVPANQIFDGDGLRHPVPLRCPLRSPAGSLKRQRDAVYTSRLCGRAPRRSGERCHPRSWCSANCGPSLSRRACESTGKRTFV